jgi:hypothetical protein
MKKKSQKSTLKDKLPKNEGERTLLCIKLTERALTQPDSESQQYLVRQLDAYNRELEAWMLANPKEQVRNVFEIIKENRK